MTALTAALVPGSSVALVPAEAAGPQVPGWRHSRGLTQLASYAAMSLQRSGAVDLVVWVTAPDRASVLDGFARAAAGLGLDQGDGAERAAARFAAWLNDADQRWLVVLDDLRDAADVAGLWPAGPAGRLMITAGDPEITAGEPTVPVPVPFFSMREAVEYLSARLTADPGHRAGQLELAGELDGEPVALAHAAAVVAGSDLTCRDYREVYLQVRAGLEAAAGTKVPAAAATWRLSAEHAEILAPGAGTWPLLVLAALLDAHGIPLQVFTAPAACAYLAGGDHGRQDQAVDAAQALQDAGLLLLDTQAAPPVARMNAAVQAAVRAQAPAELLENAVAAAADALLAVWPKDQPGSPTAALLRSCAASLRLAAGDALWDSGGCHRVLLTAGHSLDAAGLPGPAALWWQQLADDAVRLLGHGHPDTVAATDLLAAALLAGGRAVQAVTEAEQVLASRVRTLGPDDRGTITATIALGRALAAAGRPGDAVTVLDDAVDRSERVYGADDDSTLSARAEHAAACLAAGQPAEAIRSLQRSLTGLGNAHGPGHPATLAAAAQLASAYVSAGRMKDAIALWQQLLGQRERSSGPNHPDTLAARSGLAAACSAAGRMDTALHHYQEACAGYERALGATHPDTLACRASLARTYYDAGHFGDAVTLLRASITAAAQALPSGDPATRALRELLAEITDETAAR